MTPLAPSQVAALLSVREFALICSYFDLKYRAARLTGTMMRAGDWGTASGAVQFLTARTPERPFEIFEVRRSKAGLHVICCGEDGQTWDLDCGRSNLLTMPLPVPGAAPQEKRAS